MTDLLVLTIVNIGLVGINLVLVLASLKMLTEDWKDKKKDGTK